jgi:hypothetical protein
MMIGPAIENKSNKIIAAGTTAAFHEVRTFYLLLIVILIFHRFFQDQGARLVAQGGSGHIKYSVISNFNLIINEKFLSAWRQQFLGEGLRFLAGRGDLSGYLTSGCLGRSCSAVYEPSETLKDRPGSVIELASK